MPSHLTRLMRRYSEIAENSLSLLYEARAEVRGRAYTPAHLISDSFALWLNAVDAWYTPFEPSGPEEPRVLLTVDRGQDRVESEVELWKEVRGTPTSTKLRPVEEGDPIPREKVLPELLDQGQKLRVVVSGLAELDPAAGPYLGRIHVDEQPIATVLLVQK